MAAISTTVRYGTRETRRRWIGLLAFHLAFAVVPRAWGNCLPLPSPDLSALDAEAANHPDRVISAAQDRIASLRNHPDPWVEAQLYTLLAEGEADKSLPQEANDAIDRGLERLQSVEPSHDSKRVRLRLELLRSELASGDSNSAASVTTITRLLVGLPEESMERACALSERAIAFDYLNQPDKAVADALTAYQLAASKGWNTARMETAFTLAHDFRRAGLYEQASNMIDVVIDIEKSQHLTANLITAEYELAQLLITTQRIPEARAAIELAKSYAVQIGDRFGQALADLPLCRTLIIEHELAAADEVCSAGEDDFVAGGRPDFAALMLAQSAALDLERSRPAVALGKLDKLIARPLHALLPGQESQIYRDRGRALAALGRYPLAVKDLTRAHDIDLATNVEQRNRQVAVLSALIEATRLTAANRLLEQTTQFQQQELAVEKQARLLWATLAITAACLCGTFAYLFVLGRRHTRSLRRHEIILRSASSRAPDAILLLDEARVVRFANRNILGQGPLPPSGAALDIVTPPELLPRLTAAIDEALRSSASVTFRASLLDHSGRQRHYELSVLPAVDGANALGVTLRSSDVTDLRTLEREVLDSASLERQRLSSELHEGIGQQLAGVLLMLGNLATVIKRDRPGAAPLTAEIEHLIVATIKSAGELARDLAPVKIGAGSLPEALQRLKEDSSLRLSVALEVHYELQGHILSDVAEDHLYRICREAVSNAALHGHCTQIVIALRIVNDTLIMSVTDNGAGRPWPQAGLEEFGIKMMAYRARLLGGELRMTANPSGGTTIAMTAALSQVEVTAAVLPLNRRPPPNP